MPSYLFSQNYDPTFLELKEKEEQKTIHVNHTNKQTYYKPFPKEELSRAIQATKSSALGPDKSHNEMLKHLPSERLDSLFVPHNKIWQQGDFPEKWLESTTIQISKPGKDPTYPSIHRPIALTNVLCKVMDIMVGIFGPERSTVIVWKQNQTNNY